MKVTITREQAEEMLARSEGLNYRRLDSKRVERYARDMEQGKWEYNGETIKLGADGSVKDGQHRLMACVKSGKRFVTEVIERIESTLEVDRGKLRNLGDAIQAEGLANAKNIASFVNVAWKYAQGSIHKFYHPCNTSEGMAIVHHEGVYDAMTQVIHMSPLLKKGCVGTIAALTILGKIELASEFWEGVSSGANLDKGDPRLTLRERLLSEKSSHAKLGPVPLCAMTIKGFNYYVADRPLHALGWRRFGSSKEVFPEIIEISPDRAKLLLGID